MDFEEHREKIHWCEARPFSSKQNDILRKLWEDSVRYVHLKKLTQTKISISRMLLEKFTLC